MKPAAIYRRSTFFEHIGFWNLWIQVHKINLALLCFYIPSSLVFFYTIGYIELERDLSFQFSIQLAKRKPEEIRELAKKSVNSREDEL
jgi:hypothetical protein